MKKWEKGLIAGGAAVSLAVLGGVVLGESANHGSNTITLNVDCSDRGPNAAVAGGLNGPQEMAITLKTPQGSLHMTAKLGAYSLDGVQRSRHPAGEVLADIGSARVIAGAPDTANNTYVEARDSVTLICNGVQPSDITSGY